MPPRTTAHSPVNSAAATGSHGGVSTAPVQQLRARRYAEQTPRGAATRAKLLALAERLFAERSIDGVTLSDINQAAGQRNRNALQYHFGNKQGLIQAILDKHLPGIAVRRDQLLDDIAPDDPAAVRKLVRALVYPVAEKMFDPDGGREFIRVNAQLIAQHATGLNRLGSTGFQIGSQERMVRALNDALRELPDVIVRQRALMATVLLFDGLADHSRMLRTVEVPSLMTHTELFIRNLEDGMVALLAAPISGDVESLLRRLSVNA